ncbi:MAG: glycosyltransferase [Gemmatimonadaceae bacterium]
MTSRRDRNSPLVSIITPAYNAAPFLAELIASVQRQSYRCIEHIVIDDGSTDGGATLDVLRRHPEIRWWTRENRGQYASLNEGFRAARGELITTISADDYYVDADAIAAVVSHYQAHGRCEIIHGYSLYVDMHGAPLPVQPYQDYPYWMLRYFPGFILHCSLFVRRERLVADSMYFDESLRLIGDADWMLRMYLAGYRHCRIPQLIGAYRRHDSQVSLETWQDPLRAVEAVAQRAAFERRYVRNRTLARLARAYVTFQRRRGIAQWALRTGGVPALTREIMSWRRRKLGDG